VAVTKLKGRQTSANDKYDPSGTGLASDREVELRVQQHSQMFHHNTNDVIKLYFTDGLLSSIKTFNNDDEDILLGETTFTFESGDLSEIVKKIYNDKGELYMHLKKTFIFNNGELLKITNEKIK